MELERIRALRGPSIWSSRLVMEAIVRPEEGEQSVLHVSHFHERLMTMMPGLSSLQYVEPEGGLGLVHVLEQVVLLLQVQAGCNVSFSRTVSHVEDGLYTVVVEYTEEEVGRLAFSLAEQLCKAVWNGENFDVAAAANELRNLDEEVRFGPSTVSIVKAAVRRGIPFRRLTSGSLVQFGWGTKQHRILAAETDHTSAIAESIAQDKELTKRLLSAAGVPVADGRSVNSAEDAWAAAVEIGHSVVLKPRDGSQGRGVTVNLTTKDQVMAAYEAAAAVSTPVLIERFAPGQDYRILVIGGHMIAAARREPPQVLGNGRNTVRELVDKVNEDPRRTSGHATSLSHIRIDDIALSVLTDQGFTPDSVPDLGVRVVLRRNANLSTGGTATDVTDFVHPDIIRCALDAVAVVGLDICGVDMICESIDRPLEEQEGIVVELNAAPGLRMHIDPSYGMGRAVGDAVIQSLFPAGNNGRIPLVSVAGTNGKTTIVRLIAHLLRTQGTHVGMTCSDGVYIDERRIDTGDCSGPKSARRLLLHPYVEAAVCETARGGILREGLGFDRCDVAVVSNVGSGDHLGLSYIQTVEDLTVVKRVIVQNVSTTGTAVLNAADPLVAGMASTCPGTVTFFAVDRHTLVLKAHLRKGGRGLFVDDGCIVARKGAVEERLPLAAIPLTCDGTIPFQVENAMAAIGAAWGLGIKWDVIRAGLHTFESDARTAPGRFNVMSYNGARVIADYGHNPDAIVALVGAIDKMPGNRRLVVISAAGDRRDVDIRRQGEIIGDAFDEIVLYQDKCQRGRTDGEVIGLLREGLVNAKRATKITEVRGEFLAFDTGLAALNPGDIALILVDQVDESIAYLQEKTTIGM